MRIRVSAMLIQHDMASINGEEMAAPKTISLCLEIPNLGINLSINRIQRKVGPKDRIRLIKLKTIL